MFKIDELFLKLAALQKDDFSPTLNFRALYFLGFERKKVQQELLKFYLK